MDQSDEILNNGGGRGEVQRGRRWSREEKVQIVAETLEPGTTVNAVAERHGLQAHHLSSWRTLARKGKLVPPGVKNESTFTPVAVSASAFSETVADKSDVANAAIEIVFGSVRIRLDDKATAIRIAALVHALNAAT